MEASPPDAPPQSPSLIATLIVTNSIKVGGLIVAINEALLRTDLRPGALGVAAFMMAGATGLESLLDKLLGK